MKKIVIILFHLIVVLNVCGQKLSDQISLDTMSYVYKLNESQTRFIIHRNSITDTSFLFSKQPIQYARNKFNSDTLNFGHYIVANIIDNRVNYRYVVNSPLVLSTRVIENQAVIFIRNKKDKKLIEQARVYFGDDLIKYDKGLGGYAIPFSSLSVVAEKLKPTYIKIEYLGESYFENWRITEYKDQSPQKWHRFNEAISPGYLILDKPLYRPSDTLHMKAFLVNIKNGKPIRRKISLSIEEPLQHFNHFQKLKRTSPGAYLLTWVLPDTLHVDRNFSLKLWYTYKSGIVRKSTSFKLEEYSLTKNKYDVNLPNQVFFAGDDIRFFATAQDYNGFPIAGTQIHYNLRIQKVISSLVDTFTLSQAAKNSWLTKDTVVEYDKLMEFKIPTDKLPRLNAEYAIDITFVDPVSFEKTTVTKTVIKYVEADKLLFYQQLDSLHIRSLYNLKDTARKFTLITFSGKDTLIKKTINTPCHLKLNESETKAILIQENLTVTELPIQYNRLFMTRIDGKRSGDSIQISFKYPFAGFVHYKIYKKEKLIKSGEGHQLIFNTPDKSLDLYSIILTTDLQNDIEQNFYKITFVPQSEKLYFKSSLPPQAFPGQTIPVEVSVSDFAKKAIPNINICYYAVNGQFEENIVAPQIEVPAAFRNETEINLVTTKNKFTLNTITIPESFYSLKASHFQRFELYKNEYYQLRYPRSGYTVLHFSKQQRNPELSIAIINQERMYSPKYILIDGHPVYISDINEDNVYSFRMLKGTHKIAFRYFDRLYTIEKFNAEPHTKYIIGMNIDSMPSKHAFIQQSDSLNAFEPTTKEKDLLYSSLLITNQFEFDSLRLYDHKDSLLNAQYNDTDDPSLNIDGDPYYVFGPFANESKVKFVMNKKPHELKVGSKYAHHYNPILQEFKTINLPTVKGAVFNFLENHLNVDDVLELAEKDTVTARTEAFAMKPNSNVQDRIENHEDENYYQSYHTQKGTRQLNVNIENTRDSIYVKSIWFIHHSDAALCEFVSTIPQRKQQSLQLNVGEGLYDIYVLCNNNKMTKLLNKEFQENDAFYLSSAMLKKEQTDLDKLQAPLQVFNELTQLPIQPFYETPLEGKEKIKTIPALVESPPYLHGFLTSSSLEPIDGAIIYLELNGKFMYGAVTNIRGEFEIKDIIPGTYQVKIYHSDYLPLHYQASFFKESMNYSLSATMIDKLSVRPLFETIQNDFHFMAFVKQEMQNILQLNFFDKGSRAPLKNCTLKLLKDGEVVYRSNPNLRNGFQMPFPTDQNTEYVLEISKVGYSSIQLREVQFKEAYTYNLHVFLTKLSDTTFFRKKEFRLQMLEMPEYETVEVKDFKAVESKGKEAVNSYGKQSEIYGKITDERKEALDFVPVVCSKNGIVVAAGKTDLNGNYRISPLEPGHYAVKVSCLGFQTIEVKNVVVTNNSRVNLNLSLEKKVMQASKEVLIREYRINYIDKDNAGTSVMSRSDMRQSATSSTGDFSSLQSGSYQRRAGDAGLSIGGSRSGTSVYMIDGVLIGSQSSEAVPNSDSYSKIAEFKLANSTTYAGTQLMNEYLKTNRNHGLRKNFSDIGFWEPNLISDKNGMVRFSVTLPDNITSWKSYLVGMGSHWKHGIDSSTLNVFKPLQVNSILPTYIYPEDKIWAKAKFQNLTSTPIKAQLSIRIDKNSLRNQEVEIEHQIVDSILLAPNKDSMLNWEAELSLPNGYKDIEQLKVPVFSSAMTYSNNQTMIMERDSIYTLDLDSNSKGSLIFNNVLYEKVLAQIELLSRYQFGCVEQTSSKLKALLMKDKIHQSLGIKESSQKEINSLINRLDDFQNQDGSWGWWRKQNRDHRITIYATEILQMASLSGYTNNLYLKGQDYLMNEIETFSISDKLYALYVLSKSNISESYLKSLLSKISIDNLQLIDKLYYYKLQQLMGITIPKHALYAVFQEINGASKRIHTGNFFYDAKGDIFSAYSLFDGTPMANNYLQTFKLKLEFGQLEDNLNTFTRAALIEGLTKLSLQANQKPIQAEVIVNDTLHIKTFPYTLPLNSVHYTMKHRGGKVFLNTAEERTIDNPVPHDSAFSIRTFIDQEGRRHDTVAVGQRCQLHVQISSFHQANHVMIEIPIPAGFRVIKKENMNSTNEYIEYQKSKVIIFKSQFNIGTEEIKIELQSIFRGDFTMPASKVSLMYYPFVYGNNENQRIFIR